VTDLNIHPAWLRIEDRLDAMGQKFRAWRLVRGVCVALLIIVTTTLLAVAAAHAISVHQPNGSVWNRVILVVWGLITAAALLRGVLWPMLFRPRADDVARLLESRVGNLHNGFTNALQLSKHANASQFLPSILEEISEKVEASPLNDAIRWSDLRSWFLACAITLLAAGVLTVSFPQSLLHGWRQMIAPSAFVPTEGRGQIVSVLPGNTTVVDGSAVQIVVKANAPSGSIAKLIVGNESHDLSPATAGDALRYTFDIEHLTATSRYRVEIAGTQSEWYTLTVVPKFSLTELSAKITPPAYLQTAATNRPLAIDAPALQVPQGSQVELNAALNVSAAAAALQIGEAPAVAMTTGGGNRFTGEFKSLDDSSVRLLVQNGKGETLGQLPAEPIHITVVKDQPPSIQMKWPANDVTVSPSDSLRISAIAKDDHGVSKVRLLISTGEKDPLHEIATNTPPHATAELPIEFPLDLPEAQRKDGSSVRIQLIASDNRDLGELAIRARFDAQLIAFFGMHEDANGLRAATF